MTKLNTQKVFALFLIAFCFSSQSFAAASGGSGIKPSIGAMMLFGSGKMGDGGATIPDRSMLYTPITVFAGFNIKKLRIGVNYEYDVVGQSDDPAGVLNQNLGGKGSAPGIRFDYYNGTTSFGLVYHLSQKYTLDKPTVGGTVSEYEGKSGFSIQYFRQIKNKIGIVVDYSMGEMKSSAGISNDIKWNRAGIGIVFTNFAGGGGKR